VPTNASHASTRPPKLAWGALATAAGAAPSWNGSTCSGVYCHGATLRGGTRTAPSWTTVDGSQVTCGACHAIPPATGKHRIDDHVQAGCGACHPGYGSSVNAALHANGAKDVGDRVTRWTPSTRRCVGCHESATW
jgi:predicted CxxxxCH...CXXCH cytochrome family protein